jgi:hypothetical protein
MYKDLYNYLIKNNSVYFIMSDYNSTLLYSNFPTHRYNLTRIINTEENRSLSYPLDNISLDKKWIEYTNILNFGYFQNCDMYDNVNNILKKCVYFQIVTKEYGINSVENHLLKFYNLSKIE